MSEVEVPLPSELCVLVNFIVVDVLLLSLVMHVSSLLAGHANHHILSHYQGLHLKPFTMPIIGGGLVTARGFRRTIFIIIRLSVVVAAVLCNYGLEGRSRPSFKSQPALMRVPGPLLEDNGTVPSRERIVDLMYASTRYRMNCLKLTKRGLVFGSVINTSCYHDMEVDVFIKSFDFEPELVDTRATECKAKVDCEFVRTTFRCKQADIVCAGVDNFSKRCPGWAKLADYVSPLTERNCHAVIYAGQGDRAWMCDRGKTWPGKRRKRKEYCESFQAKRESVERWVDYYMPLTLNQRMALFAAAYGTPKQTEVTVPDGGQKAVTVVNMFWFVSVAWVLAVAIALSGWKCVHIVRGTPRVAHDENGLSRLLDRQIKVRSGEVDMGNKPLDKLRRRTVARKETSSKSEASAEREQSPFSTIFIV